MKITVYICTTATKTLQLLYRLKVCINAGGSPMTNRLRSDMDSSSPKNSELTNTIRQEKNHSTASNYCYKLSLADVISLHPFPLPRAVP